MDRFVAFSVRSFACSATLACLWTLEKKLSDRVTGRASTRRWHVVDTSLTCHCHGPVCGLLGEIFCLFSNVSLPVDLGEEAFRSCHRQGIDTSVACRRHVVDMSLSWTGLWPSR